MHRTIIAASIAVVAVLLGLSPFEERVAALERTCRHADTYELFSLDPTYRDDLQAATTRPIVPATGPATRPRAFHGYLVFGSTKVDDAKTRATLNDAYFKDVEFMDGAAGCFSPRHGLRLTTHDEHGQHVTDVLVCFECRMLSLYKDGGPAETSFLRFADADDGHQPAFDAVLKAAGIELAPPPPPGD